MRTRIKDIAERVGVSTALVSMYLNDHPLARMSEDTKRKIDEAVREMNYQPSATARSLKKGKSKTLGLVIGDIATVYSGFYSEMLLDEADRHGYQLLISVTRFNKKKEQKCLQNLINRQADGILYTLDFDPQSPLPDCVRNYPLLLTTEHPECNMFLRDYSQCFRDAFALLVKKGIRNALFVFVGDLMPVETAKKCGAECGVAVDFIRFGSAAQILALAQDRKACLFFLSSIVARKFQIYCYRNEVRNIPPLINSYSLPFDYFEAPNVVGAMFEPFKEKVPRLIERLIEMVEKPEPQVRTCFLPMEFVSSAALKERFCEQSRDSYYETVVEERENVLLGKEFLK